MNRLYIKCCRLNSDSPIQGYALANIWTNEVLPVHLFTTTIQEHNIVSSVFIDSLNLSRKRTKMANN